MLIVEVMGQLSNYKTRLLFAQLPGIPELQLAELVREVSTTRRLRRLKPGDVARLIQSYLEGATLGDLASHYSVNRTTVSNILRRAGVRRFDRRLSSNDVEEVIQLYGSGQSLSDVAYQLKVSPNTIRNHLLRAGVKTRNSHGGEQ